MKPKKISDVLWLAANEHLSITGKDSNAMFSCDAVLHACNWEDQLPAYERTMDFLRELGVDTASHTQFAEFETEKAYFNDATEKSQGARYLWLMFAYLVAKSERK